MVERLFHLVFKGIHLGLCVLLVSLALAEKLSSNSQVIAFLPSTKGSLAYSSLLAFTFIQSVLYSRPSISKICKTHSFITPQFLSTSSPSFEPMLFLELDHMLVWTRFKLHQRLSGIVCR